jgi:putative N6-adenine-specific DNA methylase
MDGDKAPRRRADPRRFGQRGYLKHIGLRPTWKKPVPSGGLDGRLARFDMY